MDAQNLSLPAFYRRPGQCPNQVTGSFVIKFPDFQNKSLLSVLFFPSYQLPDSADETEHPQPR